MIKFNSDNFWREKKSRDWYGIKDEIIRIKLNRTQSYLRETMGEKVGKKVYNYIYDILYETI